MEGNGALLDHDWLLDEPPANAVIKYIDETFDQVLSEIQKRPYGKPQIALKRITALKPYHGAHHHLQWQVEDREVVYGFPGKSAGEAWRFGMIKSIIPSAC